MTRFFLVALLLITVAAPLHAVDGLDALVRDIKQNIPNKHQEALNTAFLDENFAKTTLLQFEGEVLLVNFWATWCAPCVKEMPALDELQAKYGDEGLRVVSVSQDFGGLPTVQKFYERFKLQHMAMYVDDKNQLFTAFEGNSLPFTVLIDRTGAVVGQYAGYINWQSASRQLKIQQLLRQQ